MDEPQREDIDRETFSRFQSGDRDAAYHIISRFHRPLLSFLRQNLGDPDLAEDTAQEVFLRLLEHRAQLRGHRQLASWIFTVAIRSARKSRSRTRAVNAGEVSHDEVHEPPAQDGAIHEAQRLRIIHEAMGSLPERDRELLNLRFFAGLSIKELAETLGMPMGSVGVKIGRSLQRVRKELESAGHRLEDLL